MTPLLAVAEGHAGESLLLTVLVELVVIIAAARGGAWLLGRLGQPQVVGEIAAGLLLGPSFLGRISPGLQHFVFPDAVAGHFKVLSELGLVLLMFLIGLEFEFGHLRRLGRAAVGVSVAGIVFPFGLGLLLAWRMHPLVAAELNQQGFMLFMAVALSITAIPILGRIMIEFNLTRTRMGALAITAAAVDDATGWILLAAVSASVRGNFQAWSVARMMGLTLAFVLVVLFVVRPLLIGWSRRALAAGNGELGVGSLAALLLVIFGAAIVTNGIGIFSIFGPFVLGAALWDQHLLRAAVTRRLRDFVTAFFLPIFFTYTGLRTNVGTLETPTLWMFCALVLAAAIAGKVVGCGLAARAGGQMTWRESACVAVMMNTRALMELIVINVGRDLGVIPDSVFCMLVIMALVTTFMTAPLLRLFLPKDEPPVASEPRSTEVLRC